MGLLTCDCGVVHERRHTRDGRCPFCGTEMEPRDDNLEIEVSL